MNPEERVIFEGTPAEVRKKMASYSRRGFAFGGVAAIGAFYGLKWLTHGEEDSIDVPPPFRKVLDTNEAVFSSVFSGARTEEAPSNGKLDDRVNGDEGLSEDFDVAQWNLSLEGASAKPLEFKLADLKSLKKTEMTTEFRCIEGWSALVHWGGVRLGDLIDQHVPAARQKKYVGMMTPDGGYYVGLDMASALHPQTLLAYEMNGQPLTMEHGAPLRLAIPVKYGVKNIKRIGTITFTDERPADFWAEQGYDWYCGL